MHKYWRSSRVFILPKKHLSKKSGCQICLPTLVTSADELATLVTSADVNTFTVRFHLHPPVCIFLHFLLHHHVYTFLHCLLHEEAERAPAVEVALEKEPVPWVPTNSYNHLCASGITTDVYPLILLEPVVTESTIWKVYTQKFLQKNVRYSRLRTSGLGTSSTDVLFLTL